MEFESYSTLFFEIYIAPADSDNYLKIPEFLSRSIERVEMKMLSVEHGNSQSSMEITFKERLLLTPQEENELIKTGILSSKSGLWLDLKFLKSQYKDSYGFYTDINRTKEYYKAEEVKLNDLINTAKNKDATDKQIKELEETMTILKDTQYSSKYLLATGNKIRLVWGYKNKDKIYRVNTYSINMIKHKGDKVPSTVITCFDLSHNLLNSISPISGLNFTNQTVKTIIGENIASMSRVEKNSPANYFDILVAFCKLIDVRLFLHPELQEALEKYKYCTNESSGIPVGASFSEFLKRLSTKFDFIYNLGNTTIDGATKDTLFCHTKKFLRNFPIFTFIWKQHQKIENIKRNNKILNGMQSWGFAEGQITAGMGASGVDSDTGNKQQKPIDLDLKYVFTETQSDLIIDTKNPIKESSNKTIAKSLTMASTMGVSCSSKTIYSPRDKEFLNEDYQQYTKSNADSGIRKLSFVHLGDPELFPCQIELLGLGERASGLYWMYSVAHVIEPGRGYICNCECSNVTFCGDVPLYKDTKKTGDDSENKEYLDFYEDKNDKYYIRLEQTGQVYSYTGK